MAIDTLFTPPKLTTYQKPKSNFIKKALTIVAIVFSLFILPATVNVALSSQDVRNNAQVITDQAASDSTVNKNSQNTSNSDNIFWKIYPFVLGVVVMIWAVLIFIYFGSKFSKRL